MKTIKHILITAIGVLVLGCGGVAPIISTPVEDIDTSPLKESELTETQKQNWQHLDLVNDTIPGMAVDKAYNDIIKGKKGVKVIVAVIDSGIDIDHEDLDGVIWTNKKEKPNNGIDDDKNGYVDDMHGWNFLGEGYNEQLEYVRLLASGNADDPRYAEAEKAQQDEYQKYSGYKTQYEQILQQVKGAHETLKKHFGKEDYTKEEVNAIKSEDQSLTQAVNIARYMYSNNLGSLPEAIEELSSAMIDINDRLNYNLNKDFKGRKTGDNINDLSDVGYGNGNVKPVKKSEAHGTHVAGIIAAERNNGKGGNGVANNVEIMSLRAVPNGDEYDKDIALAIRYAVDNGAKVINGSFGKDFSPHSQWVRDAIAYADQKDVVIIHAAGNDSKDLDSNYNFPNDQVNNGPEVSNSFITVGSLAPKYGTDMVSGFSNYGKINVDVFAPGSEVYSTTPENEYKFKGGTSMAAPAVAGIAALIRSQFPSLSSAEVKQAIVESGLHLTTKVVVGGEANDVRPFAELSKYGTIANAYNALIKASQLANNQ
ncbi:S8 family serine peptidase [Ichthyenterobacterium sp. W332]|uniref:S8 family serine peptidase n=1 Tax=Microcosmobacter mediterraneus TaxID=3075607 RepID=A0ABU2YJJ7_9FLAO|nr:S8 family serine peptidase [Ichthyenterobacterium sp. W332]MDT0557985.1 S8 family serine peptidase [Ichthyenterobacterium sp. W332]